jgi:hypothetical protein
MARSRKQNKDKLSTDQVTTKRWLRKIITQAIQLWAPALKLDSFVDQISFYIADGDDPMMDALAGAEILVDSTTRTAMIKIKNNVVAKFASEYAGEYSPTDIVEMTVIHELSHILTHPISKWAHSTIETMRNNKALENLFSEQEEIIVEHLARLFFAMKSNIEAGKFKGKIIYLTKDPDVKEG